MTLAPTLVFDEPTEYHRADYETASMWSKYEIEPGRYEVEFVTINYTPCPEGARPYYALVRLNVRQVENYHENRLWTASAYASSAHHEKTPDAPIETLSRSTYAYNFEDGVLAARDGRPEKPMPRWATWLGGRIEYDETEGART